MKKLVFLFIILVIGNTGAFAQDDDFYSSDDKAQEKKERNPALQKWAFGGSFWMSFGNYTYIELSPVALYTATPRLTIGPGFTYRYEKYKDVGFESSTYGPRAVMMFTLLKDLKESINLNIGNIIFYAEDEFINIETFKYTTTGYSSEGRIWMNNLLIGGGIFQPIGGGKGGISILVLFDVTQNEYSPYSNPEIRFGFYF